MQRKERGEWKKGEPLRQRNGVISKEFILWELKERFPLCVCVRESHVKLVKGKS